MDNNVVALFVIPVVVIGLPWLFLHYVTRWKQAKSITLEDENLLDELHDIARRLDDRLNTVERIIAADRTEQTRISDPRIGDLSREAYPVDLQSRRRDRSI